MTNLERIRAMTDEELERFLMDAHDGKVYIPFCTSKPECDDLLDNFQIDEEQCRGCMREWLKKPVEVEVDLESYE